MNRYQYSSSTYRKPTIDWVDTRFQWPCGCERKPAGYTYFNDNQYYHKCDKATFNESNVYTFGQLVDRSLANIPHPNERDRDMARNIIRDAITPLTEDEILRRQNPTVRQRAAEFERLEPFLNQLQSELMIKREIEDINREQLD